MNICWGSSGVRWAVTSYSPLTSYSRTQKVAVGWRCQRGLILGGDFQTILRLCCRTLGSVVWRNECEVLVAFPFVWEKSCRGPLWIRRHWGTAVDGGTGRSAGPLVIPSWTSWSWLEHATAFFFLPICKILFFGRKGGVVLVLVWIWTWWCHRTAWGDQKDGLVQKVSVQVQPKTTLFYSSSSSNDFLGLGVASTGKKPKLVQMHF